MDTLMDLRLCKIPFAASLIDEARTELFRHEQERSEQKCVWGFFPGLEHDEQALYPKSIELGSVLTAHLSGLGGHYAGLGLSFIKLASRKPDQQFGGLHIDDRVGVRGVDAGRNGGLPSGIIRTIANLGDHPRFLMHTVRTAEDLRKRGVEISHDEYHVIEPPPGLETRIVPIPPRSGSRVWSLTFLASSIPHVGVTDEHGYFIAGLGKYLVY